MPLSQRVTLTDNDGRFKFDGLDAALYILSASAPGWITRPADLENGPQFFRLGDSVTLTLLKGAVITGTVLSSFGEPVVQVVVRATMIRDAKGLTPKTLTFQAPRMTDDRGVYRLYGLQPGTYVVSAGGRNSFGGNNAYDQDSPTYAPSSTAESAVQISVNSGDEAAGVDIRYRAESGHAISGVITGVPDGNPSAINIQALQDFSGSAVPAASASLPPGRNGFSLYGLSDGEYDLRAQFFTSAGDSSDSAVKHVVIHGSDIDGVELNMRPLGSISGRIALTKSELATCRNKREPRFDETLVAAAIYERAKLPQWPFSGVLPTPAPILKDGNFRIRNLIAGQYNLSVKILARYWYLKSIQQQTAAVAATVRTTPDNKDVARYGINLGVGEQATRVTVNLAEGAASLSGMLDLNNERNVPENYFVYLAPAEKESAADVLRFFASPVGGDGSFVISNLPPGRYWLLGQVAKDARPETKLRSPNEREGREKLLRAAEADKRLVELQPCQNFSDYKMPLSSTAKK